MPDEIPPVDPDLSTVGRCGSDRDKLEFDLLEAELKQRQIGNREAGQRYFVRWIAVMTGVIVIAVLGISSWYLTDMIFRNPLVVASPAFYVAIVVAPVFAITTITVTLFVGAFGRFKEKDLEASGNVAAAVLGQIR